MMFPFPIGQKVVCIDDRFTGAVFEDFDHVPKLGQVYTVRDIYWHEEHGTGEKVLGVDLVEVPSIIPRWSGFCLRRFRLLDDEKIIRAAKARLPRRAPIGADPPAVDPPLDPSSPLTPSTHRTPHL